MSTKAPTSPITSVRDVTGAYVGIIENPVFEAQPVHSDGPGR
ncbi:MAG: hypothetical protein U5K30_05895 [Acidimicrobiales bacterium]|nr:hypothetical protein [Acidimicrobiales bacterium]